MEEADGFQNLEDIQEKISSKELENQYFKSRNLGLQEAVEGNFMPKQESNVIEFKLSSEELLERIEHYLKGDILKTRVNEDGQVESFYTTPTKRISVTLYKNIEADVIYIVNENPDSNKNKKEDEDIEWKILSILEKNEEGEVVEVQIEENYHDSLLNELLIGLNSRKKDKPIIRVGTANKEVVNSDRVNLNEYGVQEIMNILSMYITKETFLSWYKEDRIYEILGDLGDALNKFFYVNGRHLGLNTEYKKTKYPMIVTTILHTVENAYRRALMGNENRGTREGILVTQHQAPGMGNMDFPHQPVKSKKRFSVLDKSTW